jgi:hypothetical protein
VTCIVGLEVGGNVYMGADSAGVTGWDMTVRADTKLFERGPFMMGFTSSFRMGDLLRYSLVVPEHPDGMTDREYLSTRFVDAVRTCLKEGGLAKTENDVESGGTFLLAYRGHIYAIHDDYQVEQSIDGFLAVGCASQVALGVLWASVNVSPMIRIEQALIAAEHFSAGVRRPWVFATQWS